MREMMRHRPGRIYLLLLLLSVIGYIVFIAMGGMEVGADGEPFIAFGWMTMTLFSGVVFTIFWLVAYIVYFFFFWPYR